MKKSESSAGRLFVVGTPIGNFADITARALQVLADVDLVACEDTRRTGHLLAAHQIRKQLISHYEHNEDRRVPELIAKLKQGANIALVTDAGMPAISDPGYRLVRAAHEAGITVVAVPGPSAALAALSISGLPSDRFAFEGFLPTRDAAMRRRLQELARESRTMIFFEAARRMPETLAVLRSQLGGDREAAVVREATKTHEEILRGTLADLVARFDKAEVLGEVTIVVAGAPEESAAPSISITVESLMAEGISLKQASGIVAKLTGRSRRDVYQEALRNREKNSSCE